MLEKVRVPLSASRFFKLPVVSMFEVSTVDIYIDLAGTIPNLCRETTYFFNMSTRYKVSIRKNVPTQVCPLKSTNFDNIVCTTIPQCFQSKFFARKI